MSFLNKKEEVINIELTQYGKYLLSIGKLKPEYYSFFDDDILYDANYGGISTEDQNLVQDRIKESPQLSSNYSLKSVELDKSDLNGKRIQSTPSRYFSTSMPIGSISIDNDEAPAWNMNLISGQISGSITYQSGSQPNLKIPQITLKSIEYKTKVEFEPSNEINNSTFQEFGISSDLNLLTKKFEDGSFVDIKEDFIVIQIDEINTTLSNNNFDIEVFLIEQEKNTLNKKEILIPLNFSKIKKNNIKNNILLDDVIETVTEEVDPTCVEYFFDIFIDSEIDNTLLCNEDCQPIKANNIYQTVVSKEELKDIC